MRWIFRLVGVLLVLVVVLVGVVFLIPAEKIAGFATAEISARTGRDVSFSGKIKPVFFPVLGVKTEGLSIGNASWSDGSPMITADSLLVGVELMPLISGEIKIKEFRLSGAQIRLEKTRDGQVNWELEGAGETASETGATTAGLPHFSLKLGQISDGSLRYIDHQAGTETTVKDIDLAISLPDIDAEATLAGSLAYNGQQITLETRLSGLAPLLAGKVMDLDIKVDGGFGAITFNGRAGINPVVADGTLNARLSDMAAAGQLAGTGDFSGGMFKTVGASGTLTYSEQGDIFLRDARIAIDDNRLNADIDLTLADRPLMTAKLVAGDLDFSKLIGGSGADSDEETALGWSKSILDLSALQLMDADIGFAASSVNLGMAKLGETRLRAKLDAGRLVVSLNKVTAYGGDIAGEYVINARNGLSMGGDLAIADMQLQPLLIDMADYDRLIAGTSGRLKFLTSGNSIDAMMNRLSGSGRVDIGAGEIIGLDLVGMLRNLDASYRGASNKTIFSSITGSFAILDGVLANEDLNFASGLLDATGSGQIDIAAQTVNYRVIPVAFSGEDIGSAGGISVPVLIDGPWSNLRFRPDLQGLFDAELDKQKAELEARAKANLEKIKEETEQRLKDEAEKALKKAAEDALKKALGLD
jgi:AsmA protein